MIEFFKSKISLNIKGKNINRFIKKLTDKKIDILSLKYINRKEVNIIIYQKDYEKLMKIKSIYEILELNTFGYLKIKKNLQINKHLIICFIVCFLFFIFLTNTIFNVEVIHSSKDVRTLLKEELAQNGIEKFHFKKSFDQITKIKEKILKKYPDKIEWLEIDEVGTKYIVRVEERVISNNKENTNPRSIVAKKDAIIKKVIASKGNIEIESNTYVKKGDIIINGSIMLNEKEMGKVRAKGKVYGEVWYVLKTSYPFVYTEEKETGSSKDVYSLKWLNKTIELTNKKYKTKKIKEKTLFKSTILPFSFVKQNQKETKVKNQILTFDEALIKAQEYSITKMNKSLNKDEYIIRSKYLKSSVNENSIEVQMFFAIYEDITDYRELK